MRETVAFNWLTETPTFFLIDQFADELFFFFFSNYTVDKLTTDNNKIKKG